MHRDCSENSAHKTQPASAANASQRVPEILAPAGGREQFFAALNAGADAVYLGLKSFNARARAENFTPDDLRELVPLAHSCGMKVLVTVNVLIKNNELPALIETLSVLEELEVDAIIVQDLAVARLVGRHFPALRLHASTQMAVHNLAGVLKARELGFRRVVLARELTATELRRIRDKVPRSAVELEAFCHGSLCYSYSGLCFFSGAEDARSGNRGECAYTCRQPYKIISEPGHGFLFSMRDLDTSSDVGLFVKSGVDTLKIEGRKKDAQYVATSVTLYRKKLDEFFGRSTQRPSAPRQALEYNATNGAKAASDMALAFQRQKTAFFLKGRYHENVIDLDSPTHNGIPVGRISKIEGRQLTVTSSADLERFDGLRVTPAGHVFHSLPQNGERLASSPAAMTDRYDNKHIEFSLRDLRIGSRRVATAKAGTTVAIELPPDLALPKVGDALYKVRSADLKRRITSLVQAPCSNRVRPWTQVEILVTAAPAGEKLLLTAAARKFGETITKVELTVELQEVQKASTLVGDFESIFKVMGDIGFQTGAVDFQGDPQWFVPRSRLKLLKQALTGSLIEAYPRFIADRRQQAVATICDSRVPPPERVTGAIVARRARYAVKTDRIETLEAVLAFANARPEFTLDELVFEPKRAFLNELKADELALRLQGLAKDNRIKLRLAFPTVIRAWDEPLLKRWFQVFYQDGFRAFEIGNLGAFQLLKDWGLAVDKLDLASDFTLYSLNSAATRLWLEQGVRRVCLSIEDDAANLASHIGSLSEGERVAVQAIVFKDTPLFIAEACSLTALHNGCPSSAVCGYRTLEIENPKGERFFVAHESCKSIVYGQDAYSIGHKQPELLQLGVQHFRIDFLTREYSNVRVGEVLEAICQQTKVSGTHVANFDRVLL